MIECVLPSWMMPRHIQMIECVLPSWIMPRHIQMIECVVSFATSHINGGISQCLESCHVIYEWSNLNVSWCMYLSRAIIECALSHATSHTNDWMCLAKLNDATSHTSDWMCLAKLNHATSHINDWMCLAKLNHATSHKNDWMCLDAFVFQESSLNVPWVMPRNLQMIECVLRLMSSLNVSWVMSVKKSFWRDSPIVLGMSLWDMSSEYEYNIQRTNEWLLGPAHCSRHISSEWVTLHIKMLGALRRRGL